MTINIKRLPETERPYEKLELYGAQSLSNAELLAIIIKTGTKEETSVQVAQKVLCLNDTQEEGLNFLRNIEIAELTQIKGIGRILPIKHTANALTILRFKSAAAIRPPRSSNIGINEIINTINSFPYFKLVRLLNASTNVSAK